MRQNIVRKPAYLRDYSVFFYSILFIHCTKILTLFKQFTVNAYEHIAVSVYFKRYHFVTLSILSSGDLVSIGIIHSW